jgi:hypothetical protein
MSGQRKSPWDTNGFGQFLHKMSGLAVLISLTGCCWFLPLGTIVSLDVDTLLKAPWAD